MEGYNYKSKYTPELRKLLRPLPYRIQTYLSNCVKLLTYLRLRITDYSETPTNVPPNRNTHSMSSKINLSVISFDELPPKQKFYPSTFHLIDTNSKTPRSDSN